MIALALALLTVPVADLPPDAPFPADSTTQKVVQTWVDRYLPSEGYVIGAWSPNVVMLVSTTKLKTDKWPEVSTEVLTEVLVGKAARAVGWRASVEQDDFACDRGQYRTVSSMLYKRADRQGDFKPGPTDADWRKPDDGATMDTVVRAACFQAAQTMKEVTPGAAAGR